MGYDFNRHRNVHRVFPMKFELGIRLVVCIDVIACWWFQPEGEDDLKKIQLMELAIMNGTYRDQTKLLQAAAQSARKSWELFSLSPAALMSNRNFQLSNHSRCTVYEAFSRLSRSSLTLGGLNKISNPSVDPCSWNCVLLLY